MALLRLTYKAFFIGELQTLTKDNSDEWTVRVELCEVSDGRIYR